MQSYRSISDNRLFWKTVTPYFSEKGSSSKKLMLIENGKILTDEISLANTMNDFFLNITKNLDIKQYPCMKCFNLDGLKKRFMTHESIKKIKQLYEIREGDMFSFKNISSEEVKQEILSLDKKKSSILGSTPLLNLKQTTDIYIVNLTKTINHSFLTKKIPNKLKMGEVIPIFKKKDPLQKDNYKPVTLLSHISKVFERIIHKQIYSYMENKLSKYLTGFRKNHGTQHCLVTMLEKWKDVLDKGEYICALFMDLSKAFDTINHDLMLAKLEAYGFSESSIQFMNSYLKDRTQKVQINNCFSKSGKLNVGVPQGSIIGPLLFNIFINDFTFFIENNFLCNYADDNTMYGIGKNKEDVKIFLNQDFQTAAKWFYENAMILNPEKCHYMCLGPNVNNAEEFHSVNFNLKNSEVETMLGIKIDRKLNFEAHINDLCRKASQKLNALNRIASFIDVDKRNLLYNSMIRSQFSYCPLVWMFCSRKCDNKINKIHERALRVSLQDFESDFETILVRNNDYKIHNRNIQSLMIEIYKFLKGLAPPIMDTLFQTREIDYNLRNFQVMKNSIKNTTKYGTETISYKSSALWSLVPMEIKSIDSLAAFKSKIKKWNCDQCPCKLCLLFVTNLGYL